MFHVLLPRQSQSPGLSTQWSTARFMCCYHDNLRAQACLQSGARRVPCAATTTINSPAEAKLLIKTLIYGMFCKLFMKNEYDPIYIYLFAISGCAHLLFNINITCQANNDISNSSAALPVRSVLMLTPAATWV